MQKILNKKSSIATENDKKRIKHLYNTLTNDASSIFYATSQITKNLIRKTKNSTNENKKTKNSVVRGGFSNNNFIRKASLTTEFIEKRSDIDCSTLYSFDGSFQLLQEDIAYIGFLVKSAVDPKFCLLSVDLFTSKIYTFPMKTGNLLAEKMEHFYNDIQKKEMARE